MSKSLRLLIVDDSRASREELGALLSEESYVQEIRMAKHGLEALSLADQYQPDVVLLDQNMPGLTGAEVARRLKAANSNARIIFVSADPEAKELAMAAGAEAFFVKGINTAGLIQALRVAHSSADKPKRTIKLPRKKKEPPKYIPWLWGAVRISALLLLGGIVATNGYLLVYISLFCGIMFFVYAMKYYASMVMIMAATGNGTNGWANANGNGNGNGHGNGHGDGNGN